MTAPVRREQLLDVTTAIVVEHGFHAVSIQAVARRAGISRPLVYEHFGDLDGLLQALVERVTTRALEHVSETTVEELSASAPTEQLLDSLGKYLYAVERHPSTWRLVLMPPEGAPELLRASVARDRATILNRLTRAIGPGLTLADGDPDPELTARILSALADEYARRC